MLLWAGGPFLRKTDARRRSACGLATAADPPLAALVGCGDSELQPVLGLADIRDVAGACAPIENGRRSGGAGRE